MQAKVTFAVDEICAVTDGMRKKWKLNDDCKSFYALVLRSDIPTKRNTNGEVVELSHCIGYKILAVFNLDSDARLYQRYLNELHEESL